MRVRSLIKGALTFVPGLRDVLPKPMAGAKTPTDYYYGVWLKHLTILAENGLYREPKTLAEIGPGQAIGVGLAAVLSGVDRYYGLDVMTHASSPRNAMVFDELLDLFQRRAGRPAKGWPDFDRLLDDALFPSTVLTEQKLSVALNAQRIKSIRQALKHPSGQCDQISITYRAPWTDAAIIEKDSIDLILSQSVLEHVVELKETYRALYQWLKPGGVMSHQIDFQSHGLAAEWNGHLAIAEPYWKIMNGRRVYFINREPWSAHQSVMNDCGFEIVTVMKLLRTDGISRARLAKRWWHLSDDDLNCASVLVQARKRLL